MAFTAAWWSARRSTTGRAWTSPRHEVALSIGGTVRARGASAGALGHPLDGLTWIANELSRRGYGLEAGDIIATGTWTGLHFVREPAAVVADFGSMGRVEVQIRP